MKIQSQIFIFWLCVILCDHIYIYIYIHDGSLRIFVYCEPGISGCGYSEMHQFMLSVAKRVGSTVSLLRQDLSSGLKSVHLL